jgi:ribosomal protein S18 acetylase RimI-like enzyme
MAELRVVDVTDQGTFVLVPPCADPGFDHRTCDYWEDADRGSKAARSSLLEPPKRAPQASRPRNPFLDDDDDTAANPFLPSRSRGPAANPFLEPDDDAPVENPFAPRRAPAAGVPSDAPRKLALLGRGLAVFGSYAKVLVVGEEAVAYTQFGPLSAYPRAMRLRDLYPQLPSSPLPAVITCIATTAEARRKGYALRLVRAVCDDLAARGFAAVETYPARHTDPDATSAATPEFWIRAGFAEVVDDERFPVMRLELE